jgi:transcriptional regulator with XRE-family HTH domain
MPLSPVSTGIRDLLRDPEQRHEFFKAMTQDDIAAQIRDLRKKRSLTQMAFARLTDMKQSAVSRIEQAEYSRWSLTTLFRSAAALDARWRMILEPCEEAVKEFENIDADQQTEATDANLAETAPVPENVSATEIPAPSVPSAELPAIPLSQINVTVAVQSGPRALVFGKPNLAELIEQKDRVILQKDREIAKLRAALDYNPKERDSDFVYSQLAGMPMGPRLQGPPQ